MKKTVLICCTLLLLVVITGGIILWRHISYKPEELNGDNGVVYATDIEATNKSVKDSSLEDNQGGEIVDDPSEKLKGDNGFVWATVIEVTNNSVKVSSLEDDKGVEAGDILILMLPTVSSKGIPDDLSEGDIVYVQYAEDTIKKEDGFKVIEHVFSIYRTDEIRGYNTHN